MGEVGGHRVQRNSPTERNGRIHTSTITVAAIAESSNISLNLRDQDLVWETCRGSGAGGQHRNTTDSAVKLTHLPTGIMVRCESQRSQKQNKETALAQLKFKLLQEEERKMSAQESSLRKKQVGSGMRGDKRRTIRQQDDSVVDHITGQRWKFKDYAKGNW